MEYPSNSVWGMNGEDACYSEIEEIIGYQFTNRKLCRQAFIRKDYSAYKNIEGNNEVLEFYGDAVVYLFMSMYFCAAVCLSPVCPSIVANPDSIIMHATAILCILLIFHDYYFAKILTF